MTPKERSAEFDKLFACIPGRNIDKLNKVATILCCKVNTVRVARLRTDNAKPLTERNLAILRRELAREGLIEAEAEGKAAA